MQILLRAQNGDREAFAILFEQYKNLVYKTAYLMLGESAEAGDYFVIQSIGPKKGKMAAENLGETYTTTNGLTLTFLEEGRNKSDQQFSSALVETPQGTSFIISSTLSHERVKELAEDLILVSK